jgi:hypothetical protein
LGHLRTHGHLKGTSKIVGGNPVIKHFLSERSLMNCFASLDHLQHAALYATSGLIIPALTFINSSKTPHRDDSTEERILDAPPTSDGDSGGRLLCIPQGR